MVIMHASARRGRETGRLVWKMIGQYAADLYDVNVKSMSVSTCQLVHISQESDVTKRRLAEIPFVAIPLGYQKNFHL